MSKKRVSLTLEEGLVSRLDAEADQNSVNRSQQVEMIIDRFFEGRSVSKAVVFCGGKDTEVMQEYRARPVLEHVISHLASEEIREVYLLCGRNEEEICSRLGESVEGVDLTYVSEDSPEGTAAALEKIKDEINETFVAVNGHVLTDVDLEEMVRVHREEERLCTMALTSVEDPEGYGVARLKGREIKGFEEKPDRALSRLINAGTYVFDPEIFSRLDENSLEDVFEDLADTGELSGYIYGGKWEYVSGSSD